MAFLFGKKKPPVSLEHQHAEPEPNIEADPGAPLHKQFSDATVSVLAKQVTAVNALARSTSVADNARPDVSLATDLAALQAETQPGAGPDGHVGTDLTLTVRSDETHERGVHAHRIILVARSSYLRGLLLSASTEDCDTPHVVNAPALDLAELRAAVRMCYVGEAQQWAVEMASKQLDEQKRAATEATAPADFAGAAAEAEPVVEPDFPVEWETRVGNLAVRFQDKSRVEIIEALLAADGHGGTAAHYLSLCESEELAAVEAAEAARKELKIRRELEAKLESDLASKYGINFVRNYKRPNDEHVDKLFEWLMKEDLDVRMDVDLSKTLNVDEKWEVLARHSEQTAVAAINYDNPLVVQYGGEAVVQNDLERLIHPSLGEVLNVKSDSTISNTSDCVLVGPVATDESPGATWQIPCHKTILAARCGYFRTMLVGGLFSTDDDDHGRTLLTVDESMCNLRAMQVFVGAVYTGCLSLCKSPPELAMEVYRLAHFYDSPHVLQLCESAVADLIDIDTLLDIDEWSAGIEAAAWTQRQVGRWIRQHFRQIAKRTEVLVGLPQTRFTEAISSDFVRADEDCILRAIFDYAQAAEGATEHLAQLLSHCRFPFVPEAALAALTADERALIPDELLSERAAFQPMTAFVPGGRQTDAAGSQVEVDPEQRMSVQFTDSDGNVVEFRRVRGFGALLFGDNIEQLTNGERVQLPVTELRWNHAENTLTDGPGVSTFPQESPPPLAELKALCEGTNCKWIEEAAALSAEDEILLRTRSSGEQDRGHATLARANEDARLIRQRFLSTDEPRFRLRVYGKAAEDMTMEWDFRDERIQQLQDDARHRLRALELARQLELMDQRMSSMVCRMFHPTNGRRNFDEHACDESVRNSLAANGVKPSAREVKDLLRTEKLLRLDPLTQIVYALPGQLSTEVTNQLQLRVVREAGLPDEAVNLIRSAQYLFPDDNDMKNIPHYVKYNRSRPGNILRQNETTDFVRMLRVLHLYSTEQEHSLLAPRRRRALS